MQDVSSILLLKEYAHEAQKWQKSKKNSKIGNIENKYSGMPILQFYLVFLKYR
jgi:hypothetical protein